MNSQLASKVPVLLSAFVWPGAGQFFQRRWLAGTLVGSCFAVGFGWFIVIWGQLMVSYYKMGFEFETYEPGEISVFSLLRPFLMVLAIYLVNLCDVAVAQYRIRSKAAKVQMLAKL